MENTATPRLEVVARFIVDVDGVYMPQVTQIFVPSGRLLKHPWGVLVTVWVNRTSDYYESWVD